MTLQQKIKGFRKWLRYDKLYFGDINDTQFDKELLSLIQSEIRECIPKEKRSIKQYKKNVGLTLEDMNNAINDLYRENYNQALSDITSRLKEKGLMI